MAKFKKKKKEPKIVAKQKKAKTRSGPITLRGKMQLVATVMGTSVLSKPILFTKPPKFTMPFYYVKVPACSCPHPSTLQ